MAGFHSQLEDWIRQACLLEVRSPKPGNVSPADSFEDASAVDFERSAAIIAPILGSHTADSVGTRILQAVSATRDAVGHNTNLGIVLLLTPLACVSADTNLQSGICTVLQNLTIDDAALVYEAIRVAAPGGLGRSNAQDVHEWPTVNLLQCMRLAAERDQIAAQYANNYADVFGTGLGLLQQTKSWDRHTDKRLAWVALSLISHCGDSLIARKCGAEIAAETQVRAGRVLQADWPFAAAATEMYESFDQFLRADGNRRNPGTTADMIAAIIFAALRDGICVANASETQLVFSEN